MVFNWFFLGCQQHVSARQITIEDGESVHPWHFLLKNSADEDEDKTTKKIIHSCKMGFPKFMGLAWFCCESGILRRRRLQMRFSQSGELAYRETMFRNFCDSSQQPRHWKFTGSRSSFDFPAGDFFRCRVCPAALLGRWRFWRGPRFPRCAKPGKSENGHPELGKLMVWGW